MTIHPASLTIDADGTPVSDDYGDVYYAREQGIEESRYVFIEGTQLQERLAQAVAGETLTVAETGFGTGLNFLLTLELWQRVAPVGARSHYISIEKHPITRADMLRLYPPSHPLHAQASALLEAYPMTLPGIHHAHLEGGRVKLTLIFADVGEALTSIHPHSVDCWFLDGFAPARNPDMWQEAHLHRIAATCAPEARLASFTAAGAVRRALADAGLHVERRAGFGRKRHMTVASAPAAQNVPCPRVKAEAKEVIVIGAGIAGASAAYALAQRGWRVRVLERHRHIAAEASGNPAGILYPYMARQWDAATGFYLRGMAHTLALLRQLQPRHALCGMAHYPKAAGQEGVAHLQSIPEKLQVSSEVAVPTPYGLYMPYSGWVDVPDFCRAMLAHAAVTLHYGQEAVTLHYRDGLWEVTAQDGTIHRAPVVVVASAHEAARLLSAHDVPMRCIRGQITYVPEGMLSAPVRQVLCYGGYLTPAIDGMHYLGATFDKERSDTQVDVASHERNLEALQMRFPHLLPHMPPPEVLEMLQGRAALRTVSADRMPIVGALEEHGLYVTLAHGARGLVSAPLAGEVIAHAMCEGSQAVAWEEAQRRLLDPARFTARALKKRGARCNSIAK